LKCNYLRTKIPPFARRSSLNLCPNQDLETKNKSFGANTFETFPGAPSFTQPLGFSGLSLGCRGDASLVDLRQVQD
jgi:hypothetical protein